MTRIVEAIYSRGVFTPAEDPGLTEEQRRAQFSTARVNFTWTVSAHSGTR